MMPSCTATMAPRAHATYQPKPIASCVRCGEQVFWGENGCPRCSKSGGWIVVAFDVTRGGWPFEVHREPGESDVDLVNKAATIAQDRPHLVYTVVREDTYRNAIHDGIRWMRDRNHEQVNARTYRAEGVR